MPQRLEYVGDECFSGSGLREVALPGVLEEVGSGAFEGCSDLQEIRLEEGN